MYTHFRVNCGLIRTSGGSWSGRFPTDAKSGKSDTWTIKGPPLGERETLPAHRIPIPALIHTNTYVKPYLLGRLRIGVTIWEIYEADSSAALYAPIPLIRQMPAFEVWSILKPTFQGHVTSNIRTTRYFLLVSNSNILPKYTPFCYMMVWNL